MEKQIHFRNEVQEKLAGTLHIPARSIGRGVVLAHCFTCSRHTTILKHLANDLARVGYLALRFDFSGNGQSEGRFEETTFAKQIAEMRCAINVIAREGASWIGLAGHSMGAEVSVLTASNSHSVKGVCAIAGRLSGLKPTHFLTQNQVEQLHQDGSVFFTSRGRTLRLNSTFFSDASRYDLPAVIRSFDRPLLIVHSETDEIIQVAEAHRAQSMNPRQIELFTLPEADHMLTRTEDQLRVSRAIVDWFGMQK